MWCWHLAMLLALGNGAAGSMLQVEAWEAFPAGVCPPGVLEECCFLERSHRGMTQSKQICAEAHMDWRTETTGQRPRLSSQMPVAAPVPWSAPWEEHHPENSLLWFQATRFCGGFLYSSKTSFIFSVIRKVLVNVETHDPRLRRLHLPTTLLFLQWWQAFYRRGVRGPRATSCTQALI